MSKTNRKIQPEAAAVTAATNNDETAAPPPPTAKRSRSEQSRINGAKSHGPVSPEGKATSSRNAIRHGLTANTHTVLEDESPEQYNDALSGWVDDLRPATTTELRLVEQIANIHWRLERLAMMETALLNVEMSLSFDETAQAFAVIDPIGHLAAAWKASAGAGNGLELLRRYLATLQNQFNATFKNYRALESHRLDPRRIRDMEYAPPYERPGSSISEGSPAQLRNLEEPHPSEAIQASGTRASSSNVENHTIVEAPLTSPSSTSTGVPRKPNKPEQRPRPELNRHRSGAVGAPHPKAA